MEQLKLDADLRTPYKGQKLYASHSLANQSDEDIAAKMEQDL
jgi:hypothetical protein